MPVSLTCTTRPGAVRFLLIHAVVIPAGLALAALAAQSSGLDARISSAFFDPAAATFPARGWPVLETLGHRFAKSAIIALGLLLFSAAIAAAFVQRWRAYRAVLWTTVVAMALGPSIVAILKGLNAYHCPWDLKQFGGTADYASGWFVSRFRAGRCLPSGHAAGGFCLVALYFAGAASGNGRLRTAGLVATLAAGTVFSLVRIAQGAHFLSHNIWSAAIDWCSAALVFAPLLIANVHFEDLQNSRRSDQ